MLVMIDNYDSFTHNLVRYFHELGQPVQVYRHDAITVPELEALAPQGLIISPGPGTPDDAGISLHAIEHFAQRIPILGVCLGHQAIGQVFGAEVVRAQAVMHGKRSTIVHGDGGLFRGLPRQFPVTRYHSLVLARNKFPGELKIDAWVDDNAGEEIMAIRHSYLPVFGVQFHPESVITEHGHKILQAFCQHAGLPVSTDALEPEFAGVL